MALNQYVGANLSSTTGNFAQYIEQHNSMVYDLSSVVVTAAAVSEANSTNGSQTTGNMDIVGTLMANTVGVKGSLVGVRNNEFANTTVLVISSNAVVGNSTVGDTFTVYGNTTFNANITLGATATDVVTFNGILGSSLIPDGDDTRSVGNTTSRFAAVYADEVFANSGFTLTGNNPTFVITDVDPSAEGPVIESYHNSPSPANDDVISTLLFSGENDGGSKHTYGSLYVTLENDGDGVESGSFQLAPYVAGTERTLIDVNTDNQGGVQLSFANSSATTVKLTTTADGVDVAGEISATSIDINGNGDVSGNMNFQSNATVVGLALFTNTTDGSNTTNGSVRVAGGLGVAKQLHVGANATFGGSATFAGNVAITGNLTAGGETQVTIANGQFTELTVTGQLISTGNTILGNASGDVVSFTGVVSSNVVPSADGTKNLGSVSAKWANAYAHNVISNTASIIDITVSGNTVLGSNTSDLVTLNALWDGDIVPSSNNSIDLGQTGQVWAQIHGGIISAETRFQSSLYNVNNQGDIRFFESSGNGLNYIAIQAPSALGANITLTLPSNSGSNNQYLQTDGDGGLSWSTVMTDFGISGDSGSGTLDTESKSLALLGGTGVTSAVTSNATHIIVTSSIGQSVATSAAPTFAGGSFTANVALAGHLDMEDNDIIRMGDDDDLQIFHNSSGSVIRSSSVDLFLRSANIALQSFAGDETYLTANDNGAVDLYFDNVVKLSTKSDGVDVAGEIQATSLDINGNGDISGNLTVQGNLTVSGTTMAVDAVNLTVNDSIISLNSGLAGSNPRDIGFVFERGSTGDDAAMIWDESVDKFVFGTTANSHSDGVLTVDLGTVQASVFEGSLNGTANVANLINVQTTTDTTAFVGLFESSTGAQGAKTDSGITYNATTNQLGVQSIALTGNSSIIAPAAVWTVTANNSTAATNPKIDLYHALGSANAADDATLGELAFYGDNDAGEQTRFARILSTSEDVTDGTEDGAMFFQAITGGNNTARSYIVINDGAIPGAVQLFYANSSATTQRLATAANGTILTGNVNVTGNVVSTGVYVGDDQYLSVGASQDFQIYHVSATETRLDNSQRQMKIRQLANNQKILIQGRQGGVIRDVITYNDGGQNEVIIYHDAAARISTQSTRVLISSNVTVTGSVTETSDAQLKHNINPLTNSLESIRALRGVTYSWNGEDTENIGVIAQEVQQVLPQVVDTTGEHQSVAYTKLIPVLIEAIKELTDKVDRLEKVNGS